MAKQGTKTAMPKLRFPEFQGASGWNPTPLGKSGAFIRGLTYGAGDVQDDGLLVIRSANIQDGGIVLDKDLVFVGKRCAPDQTLQPGDIAICMSNGSKALVGKSAEYSGDYAGPLTVGAFCSIFRPSLAFAKFAFESDSYADFVALAIGGGNINNLKNSDLASFEFAIPVSPSEQQKVTDCLTSLGDVIAAQRRKVEALKAHKRGLMQQLFPREGEIRPRLRFPEFRDAGESEFNTLGKLVQFSSGGTPSKAEPAYWNGDIPWISASTMHGMTIEGSDIRVTEEAIGNGTRLASKGCILVLVRGSMLFKRVPICITNRDVAFNQDVKALTVPPDLVALFLLYQLVALSPRIPINETGIGAGKIETEVLESLKVWVPEVAEQQRIADCLASLDSKISAETNRLANLRGHKQGLMQQLFPAPGAMST